MSDFYRYYCNHCGELCKGKYCQVCRTVQGRKEIDMANQLIKTENIAKGYSYDSNILRKN